MDLEKGNQPISTAESGENREDLKVELFNNFLVAHMEQNKLMTEIGALAKPEYANDPLKVRELGQMIEEKFAGRLEEATVKTWETFNAWKDEILNKQP